MLNITIPEISIRNLMSILFSFKGTITREEWWFGSSVQVVVGFALINILEPGFVFGDIKTPMTTAALSMLLTIPTYALMVKRFADQGWPAWLAFTLTGVDTVLSVGGYAVVITTPPLATLATIGAVAFLIVEIVMCGIFRGKSAQAAQMPVGQPA